MEMHNDRSRKQSQSGALIRWDGSGLGMVFRLEHGVGGPKLLDVLTRAGVLINFSIRYWRVSKKFHAEGLGLKNDLISDRLISLGPKRLLPKEALGELALVEGQNLVVDVSSREHHHRRAKKPPD